MKFIENFRNTERYRQQVGISPGDLMVSAVDVRKITESVMKREILETLLDTIEYGQAYAIQVTKEIEDTPFGGEVMRLNLEMAKLEG